MALQTQQYSIGTAVVQIFEPSGNPRQVILHNASKSSNTFIWFGGSADVTTSTGAHIDNADTYQIVLQPSNALWAISDGSDRPLHVLWQEL
jgi:hypothetical protein